MTFDATVKVATPAICIMMKLFRVAPSEATNTVGAPKVEMSYIGG